MTEESLFAAALGKSNAAERAAFLDAACAGDAALRERVERLLAADDRSGGILDHGPGPAALLAVCDRETLTHSPTRDTAPHTPGSRHVRPADPPGYELLDELGEGGMGVVYRARDTRLNRVVALKMVLADPADPRAAARFLAEAEAVAAVRHPHVVQVYECGEAGGRPFLALEYLGGGTLADRLRSSGPLPPHAAAGLLAKVAAGVAAAHDLGIVHRDLKPANVLFDAPAGPDEPAGRAGGRAGGRNWGEPKVTDFGLARRAAGSDLTRTGAIMGTPAYMSPEQAGGKTRFVGPQSDVWSLGVVLYECLAGARPFAAETLEELLAKVMSAEFAPLRSRVGRLPRDLETVVSRCLQKDPADRYPSARELAEDLGRFVRGEPVAARPVSTAERLARWVRRNPTRAAAWGAGGLAAALAAVVFVVAGLWRDAEQARDAAEAAKADEETAKRKVEDLLGVEKGLRGDLQGAYGKLEDALRGEKAAKREVAYLNYVNAVDLAYREYGANNIARARELLDGCPEDLRGWEWAYVHRLCHQDLVTLRGHTAWVRSASFSPDGRRVVTRSDDNTARVWDAETGKQLALLKGHTAGVQSASFSPDGRRVVTAAQDGTARVWDADTGKQLAILLGHAQSLVNSASFSPDGRRVVTVSDDNTARVWDAETGKQLAVFTGHTTRVRAASWSPDGRRVVTASHDGTARVWDAESGKQLAIPLGHTGQVTSASFSADGKRVVTASSDGTARVWDADTGKQLALLKGHTAVVLSASFSADGKRVVTASHDVTARVWDADTGKQLARLAGHAASFGPDGKRVVTAVTSTARVWDAETGTELVLLKGHTDGVSSASFSADGKRVVTASSDGTARVWDAESGKQLAPLRGHVAGIQSAGIDRSGRRVVTGSDDGTARVWDAETGRELALLKGHAGAVRAASFSPDGRRVVTGSDDGTARVWDAEAGKELALLKGRAGAVRAASFSPDGRRVVTGGYGTARVWDAETGRELAVLRGRPGEVWAASFSPDGRRVVTGSDDGTAHVWDAETGRELAFLRGHTTRVRAASFSPDGKRVVTAAYDKTVRVWDLDTGKLLLTLPVGPVQFTQFSGDGTRILTLHTTDQEARVVVYDARPVNRAFIKPTPLDVPPRERPLIPPGAAPSPQGSQP